MKQWWSRQRKKVRIKLLSTLFKTDTSGASTVYQVSILGRYLSCREPNKESKERQGLTIIENDVLEQVDNTKFLGVYIDQRLMWKTHVNFIVVKISKSVGLLYKAKYYLPSKSLLTLYYALIYPYFTYCNLIWASTYVTNLQRIYLLQKRAMQVISKADYKASSKPLFANLKILHVFSIHSLQVSSFMYLYQNDALPPDWFYSDLSNWKSDSSIFNKIL